MDSRNYLINGRLADVLALIQVLAYDKITNRSEQGLAEEFQTKPVSADAWLLMASEHPEFFRVREVKDDSDTKKDLVSLISRYVLPRIENSKNRPALDISTVNKLMEIAIEIHDRQVQQRDRWRLFVPIIVAVIAAAVKIVFV